MNQQQGRENPKFKNMLITIMEQEFNTSLLKPKQSLTLSITWEQGELNSFRSQILIMTISERTCLTWISQSQKISIFFRKTKFWLTMMTRDIFSRFSQNQLRTDPLCSLRWSRGGTIKVLELETSKAYLFRLKKNKLKEETSLKCENQWSHQHVCEIYPSYQKIIWTAFFKKAIYSILDR